MTPALSIIIPSFNTARLLADCLDSLRGADAEIIVVDNASADGSPDLVATDYPHVTLVRLPVNRGYGAACNTGAARATGDYLLFLNSDTRVEPGTLDVIVDAFRRDPTVAAVACHELTPEGQTVWGCRSHHTLRSAISFLSGYRMFRAEGNRYRITTWDRTTDRWVDNVSGFAWAIRKNVFCELGGFDENLFLYCEEEDMALRLQNAHHKIFYLSDARIVHLGGRSSGFLGRFGRRRMWLDSFIYLRRKHGLTRHPWLDRVVLYPFLILSQIGFVARSIVRRRFGVRRWRNNPFPPTNKHINHHADTGGCPQDGLSKNGRVDTKPYRRHGYNDCTGDSDW